MKLLYGIIYIAALGVLSHFVGQALPRNKFDAKGFPYRTAEWEKNGKVLDPVADKLTQCAMMFCVAMRYPAMWWLLGLCSCSGEEAGRLLFGLCIIFSAMCRL